MSTIAMIGYGAAGIAAALSLFYREKAKRAAERRAHDVERLQGEIDAYKAALDRATDRIRALGEHDFNSGLRFDETGALLRD